MYKFLILFAPLWFFVSTNAVTIEEIAQKTAHHSAKLSSAYRVTIVSIVSMGQQTIKDSGSLEFSPPSCYHIFLSNGKIDRSGCGDTSWITNPDGSVTRKTGDDFTSNFKTPDIAEMLKLQNAHIVNQSGTDITVEIVIPGGNNKAKAQFILDTAQWLVRKSTIIAEGGIPIESGFAYATFLGKPVISQISTVLSSGGFVKISFLDYTAIKNIPRSKFKKL